MALSDFITEPDPFRRVQQIDNREENLRSESMALASKQLISGPLAARMAEASEEEIAATQKALADEIYRQRVSAGHRFISAMSSLSPVDRFVRDLPEGMRPESAMKLLGLGAVEDVARGNPVRLDDSGQLVQLGMEVGGAALPIGKAATTTGRLVQAGGRAVVGSGLGGALLQRFENAQRIIDQANQMGDPIAKAEAWRQSGESTTVEEMILRGLGEALMETGTAGVAVGFPIAKIKFAELAGLTSLEADRIINLAATRPIPVDIGMQDASTFRPVQRARDILGKFPAANRKFTEQARNQAGQLADNLRNYIGELAPIINKLSSLSGSERVTRNIEINMAGPKRTQGAFGWFKAEADKRYKAFYDAAEEAGATVAPAGTTLAAAIERKKLRDLPRKKARGEQKKGKRMLPTEERGDVDKVLTDVLNMEDAPSLSAFINLGREIEQVIRRLPKGSDEARMLIQVKKAMEKDIDENLIGDASLKALRNDANKFFSETIDIFSGQYTRQFGRIDNSFGKVRTPSIDPETLKIGEGGAVSGANFVEMMLSDAEDVGMVRDMYRVLTTGDRKAGQKAFKEMVGLRLQQAFDRTRTKNVKGADFDITDTNQLRKQLGLDNKSSGRYAANQEMFRLAGVDLDEVGKTLDLMDKIFDEGVPDVSTFISRRVVLAGLGSGMRSFFPGASKDAASKGPLNFINSVASTAATIIALRGAATQLTSSAVLREYRRLLDPKKSSEVRMDAIKRLLVMDASFLVFDEATGGSVSEAQNRVSILGSGTMDMLRQGRRVAGELSDSFSSDILDFQTPSVEDR